MMPATDSFLKLHAHGVHVIDTGFHRPRFDACYLVVHQGRAAFIDTGTNHSVPRLLAACEALGLPREAVDYVIPTHVHLDHSGGAGLLMRELPNARLVVHPRGARHLVDPSQLLTGARAVYGEAEVARSYGEPVGVPAERVIETHDDMRLDFAGRTLRFLDTPGHARHHHCIRDEASAGIFTGDTFGLSYREFDTAQGAWILPTSTPVQFDPPAMRASVERILALEPRVLYLTHFGPVGDVPALGRRFLDLLDAVVALGHAAQRASDREAALRDGLSRLYVERLRRHGCTLDEPRILQLLAMDIELNTQGMGIWLDRLANGR